MSAGGNDDRCVHGVTPSGDEIVRYDRAGKWYAEGNTHRYPLSLADAVELATLPGGQALTGKAGGKLFDARVNRARLSAA